MEDNIKLYEYDYAAYFTGRIIEIGPHEGYSPGYLTTVPVPDSIPDGHFAKFEKHIQQWIIIYFGYAPLIMYLKKKD